MMFAGLIFLFLISSLWAGKALAGMKRSPSPQPSPPRRGRSFFSAATRLQLSNLSSATQRLQLSNLFGPTRRCRLSNLFSARLRLCIYQRGWRTLPLLGERAGVRASVFSLTLSIFIFGFLSANAQELFVEKSDIAAKDVERIYTKGLQFLMRNQTSEGNWKDLPYGGEPAVVGFSVLSMLAHGDDPNFGPYSESIRHGLDFILKQANPKTGYIGKTMYNHGFATLALAEAYGMVDDARIGPALLKAVQLILTSQANNPLGAWRYAPESPDADTTVSGAQMVALFAARNAGIAVPEDAIEKGLKFFARMQTAEGGFGYSSPAGPNAARAAIGCLVLSLAKEKNSKSFQTAFEYLKKTPPDQNYGQYYLYYASQAFFQGSPQAWQVWNRKNIATLKASQSAEGNWEGQFGSTFATSASLLSLALNYRFLPIYER